MRCSPTRSRRSGSATCSAPTRQQPSTALRERALIYGDDAGILVARTVREVVGSPAGLGPPAELALAGYGPARLERLSADLGLPVAGDPFVAARQVAEVLADRARLTPLLAAVSREAREALAGLTWGPPTGRVERARRDVDIATAHSPVDELLARGLLVASIHRQRGPPPRGRDAPARRPGARRGRAGAPRPGADPPRPDSGRPDRGGGGVHRGPARGGPARALGERATQGPARRRHRGPGARPGDDGARPRRGRARAGRGGRLGNRTPRGRRRARRGLAADHGVRRVAGPGRRRALGRPGRGMARDHPGPRAGRAHR